MVNKLLTAKNNNLSTRTNNLAIRTLICQRGQIIWQATAQKASSQD